MQERKKLRIEQSKAILKKFRKWLLYHQKMGAPKSRLGGAIHYALNQWEGLNTFLLDGRLEIDNNRAERAIKPIVIGRKNYLFMGGPKGSEAVAIMYTIVETCKQNKINPYHYLVDVLERIPTHPNKKISKLLPYNWKAGLWAKSKYYYRRSFTHIAGCSYAYDAIDTASELHLVNIETLSYFFSAPDLSCFVIS